MAKKTNKTNEFEDRLEEAKAEAIANTVDYSDVSAHDLTAILFADMGSEIESEVTNMTTGLKVKLDMLDELKALLVAEFADIRPELLTAKLANALAVTKEAKGSSLYTINGNLGVYNYLDTDKQVDYTNYLFMADIEGEATKCLDVLILESAFRSYKAQVALGTLPLLNRALTLAIAKCIKGIQEVTEDNKSKVSKLTFG